MILHFPTDTHPCTAQVSPNTGNRFDPTALVEYIATIRGKSYGIVIKQIRAELVYVLFRPEDSFGMTIWRKVSCFTGAEEKRYPKLAAWLATYLVSLHTQPENTHASHLVCLG